MQTFVIRVVPQPAAEPLRGVVVAVGDPAEHPFQHDEQLLDLPRRAIARSDDVSAT